METRSAPTLAGMPFVALMALAWAAPGISEQARAQDLAAASDPSRVDLLKLVPADARAAIYIPDVRALRSKLAKSPFFKFYQDPRTAEFFAPMRRQFEQAGNELALIWSTQGAHADQPDQSMIDRLDGAFLAAQLTAPPGSTGSGGSLVLFEHGGEPQAIADAMAPERQPGVQVRRRPAGVAGIDYIRVITTREELRPIGGGRARPVRSRVPRPGRSELLPLAKRRIVTEEHWYLGPSLIIRADGGGNSMREALSRLAGQESLASLADSPERRGAIDSFSPPPDMEIYLSMDTLASLPDLDETLLGEGADLSLLGLDELKGVALGLRFHPDRIETMMSLYAPPPRRGIAKLLFMNEPLVSSEATGDASASAGAGAAVRLVPADASAYSIYRADLAQLSQEAQRLLSRAVPGLWAMVDIFLQSPSGGSVSDFQQNFLGSLGSQWITFSRGGNSAKSSSVAAGTTLVEVRRPEVLRPALTRWLTDLAAFMNFGLETSSIEGASYYRLSGAESLDGLFGLLRPLAHVALADRWLIFSGRREDLMVALERVRSQSERGGASLASRDDWTRVREGFSADRFFESYLARGSYGALLRAPALEIIGELSGGLGASFVDLKSIPHDDVWRQYFGPAGIEMTASEDAILVSMTLYYPESRSGVQ